MVRRDLVVLIKFCVSFDANEAYRIQNKLCIWIFWIFEDTVELISTACKVVPTVQTVRQRSFVNVETASWVDATGMFLDDLLELFLALEDVTLLRGRWVELWHLRVCGRPSAPHGSRLICFGRVLRERRLVMESVYV